MAASGKRTLILAAILVAVGGYAFAGGHLDFLLGSPARSADPVVMPVTDAAADVAAPARSIARTDASAAIVAPAAANDAAATSPDPDPAAPDGLRILVSIDRRRLWLVKGEDTLMRAPVAIGMGKDFTYNGRKYHFATPRGTRKVIAKVKDPLWIVPEWHYYEKAAKMNIDEVVKLGEDSKVVLGDSSVLEVRDDQVGRVNHFGFFAPLTPGTEIVFDHTMYIPPTTTKQRRVPNALGPYKLDTGDGYLIHGTHVYNEDSIGEAVSHGCVRMTNEDLTKLYPLVPRGTPVIIF
jgi:L,D-transpeptidase catalytic domain